MRTVKTEDLKQDSEDGHKSLEKQKEVETSNKVLNSIKKEVIEEMEGENKEKQDDKDKEKVNQLEVPQEDVKEEKEEDREGLDLEMMFVGSEEPLLDVYEVEGRPHHYCLLREVTRRLGVSRRDLIVAAKSIETLEISSEEFESRVHSCVMGMPRRRVGRGRVELIRLTGVLERLLGMETVCV